MPQEDEVLIMRARKGEPDAIEALLSQYEKKIYNTALRMMGNQEDAMDAAQDAMIKIYCNLPSFKGECAFYSWAYRIAVNTCLDGLRRRKSDWHIPIVDDEGNTYDLPDGNAADPESQFESAAKMEEIKQAVSQLEPEHRTVIVLRDIQGCSYQDIADILKCNMGTVKSRISRARLQLQKLLNTDMELF